MRSLLRLTLASLTTFLIAACSQTGAGPRSPGSTPGEPQGCTAIGCLNGLHLTWPQGTWKPGSYTVEVALDGAAITCTGRLPLSACAAGASFQCGPGAAVHLGESGCALPPENQGLAGIDIDTSPAHVRIVVRRDGQEIMTQEIEPQYREARPNGPDCEPLCRQASSTLDPPR